MLRFAGIQKGAVVARAEQLLAAHSRGRPSTASGGDGGEGADSEGIHGDLPRSQAQPIPLPPQDMQRFLSPSYAPAQSPHQLSGGPSTLSRTVTGAAGSTHRVQVAGAGAVTDATSAYAPPGLCGESMKAVQARWGARALGPVLWAMLAHNVAHWEAARRPQAHTQVVRNATLARSDPRMAAGGGGGGVAGVVGQLSRSSWSASPGSVSGGVGGCETGGDVAAALRATIDAGGVTGLGPVERAHTAALQSVADVCVALGAAPLTAAVAAQQLSQALHWLSGCGGGGCAVPSAAVCVTAGLPCAHEPSLLWGQLQAVLSGLNEGGDAGVSEGVSAHRVQGIQQQTAAHSLGLCSRQATNFAELVSEPFLMVLELLALALTAHGAAGEAGKAVLVAGSGVVSPAGLLESAVSAVLPVVAVQAVAWGCSVDVATSALQATLPTPRTRCSTAAVGAAEAAAAAAAASGTPPAAAASGTPPAAAEEDQAIGAGASLADAGIAGAEGGAEMHGVGLAGTELVMNSWEAVVSAALQDTPSAARTAATQLLPLLMRAYLLHSLLTCPAPHPAPTAAGSAATAAATTQLPDLDIVIRYAALDSPEAAQQLADDVCARMGVISTSAAIQAAVAALQASQVDAGGTGFSSSSGGGVGHSLLLRWAGHLKWAAAHSQRRHTAPADVRAAAAAAATTDSVQATALSALISAAHRHDSRRLLLLPPPPSLIELPHSFQDLFLKLTDKVCVLRMGGVGIEYLPRTGIPNLVITLLYTHTHTHTHTHTRTRTRTRTHTHMQACDVCGKVVPHPNVCLLTGRLLCSLWRGCYDDRGAAMIHTMEACGGSTLVLSLKSTKVMSCAVMACLEASNFEVQIDNDMPMGWIQPYVPHI